MLDGCLAARDAPLPPVGPTLDRDSSPMRPVNRDQFVQNVASQDGQRRFWAGHRRQVAVGLIDMREYACSIKMRNIRDRSGVPLDNFGSADGGLSVEVSGGAAAAPISECAPASETDRGCDRTFGEHCHTLVARRDADRR